MRGHPSHQVSNRNMLSASFAAIAIGGPLLGIMGFSFLMSTMFLIVCSPLLLLFSPLLLGVALLFVGTLVGFGVALAMALTGLSMFGWIMRETRMSFGGLSELGYSSHRMKGQRGDHWADTSAATTA